MDEKEIIRHMEYVQRNASADYLNPGPELYGKYRVCKDYQVIAVFETEAEALAYAETHTPGSVEIRRAIQTDDGVSSSVMIPGAIRKLEN